MFDRRVIPHQQLSDEEKREHTDRVSQTFNEYNTMPDKIVVEMPQSAQDFFDGVYGLTPNHQQFQMLFGEDSRKNCEYVCSKWCVIQPHKYKYGRTARAKRQKIEDTGETFMGLHCY
jgi:hypothetical protein